MHHHKNDVMSAHLGDKVEDLRLFMFVDASFAGDLRDSKSTSGMYLCIAGPNTWVPITWICKKQSAVSHSSAEAEIIALEAGMRTEATPMLILWELAIDVFATKAPPRANMGYATPPRTIEDMLSQVDYVPPTVPLPSGRAKLIILEDNDAVIKMCLKQRTPAMRHVTRTHRVDLDFVVEQVSRHDHIKMRFVKTTEQAADIFTKGSFTEHTWYHLLDLIQIAPMKVNPAQHTTAISG